MARDAARITAAAAEASAAASNAGLEIIGTTMAMKVSGKAKSKPSPAGNWAFDVTPARLVTGLITERGVAPATEAGLAAMFPDLAGTG